MRRRFLQRKEPDCPAIILFRYSDCETSGFPRTGTTTSTRRSPQFRSLGLWANRDPDRLSSLARRAVNHGRKARSSVFAIARKRRGQAREDVAQPQGEL